MRKKVTFFFLFVFLLNGVSLFTVYRFFFKKQSVAHTHYLFQQRVLKVSTRKSARNALLDQGFTKKNTGEYTRNGEWYDVIKLEKRASVTIIYLANDSQEQEFMAFLHSFFTSFNPYSARPSDHLKHDVLRQYISANLNFMQTDRSPDYLQNFYLQSGICDAFDEVLFRPPRLFG